MIKLESSLKAILFEIFWISCFMILVIQCSILCLYIDNFDFLTMSELTFSIIHLQVMDIHYILQTTNIIQYYSLNSNQVVLMADMATTVVKIAANYVKTKLVNKRKAFVYMVVWKDTPVGNVVNVSCWTSLCSNCDVTSDLRIPK